LAKINIRIIALLIWLAIWIVGWILLGNILPSHVHSPFTGLLSPVLAFITLINDPIFTKPIFYELYLPFLIFWLVTAILLMRIK